MRVNDEERGTQQFLRCAANHAEEIKWKEGRTERVEIRILIINRRHGNTGEGLPQRGGERVDQ